MNDRTRDEGPIEEGVNPSQQKKIVGTYKKKAKEYNSALAAARAAKKTPKYAALASHVSRIYDVIQNHKKKHGKEPWFIAHTRGVKLDEEAPSFLQRHRTNHEYGRTADRAEVASYLRNKENHGTDEYRSRLGGFVSRSDDAGEGADTNYRRHVSRQPACDLFHVGGHNFELDHPTLADEPRVRDGTHPFSLGREVAEQLAEYIKDGMSNVDLSNHTIANEILSQINKDRQYALPHHIGEQTLDALHEHYSKQNQFRNRDRASPEDEDTEQKRSDVREENEVSVMRGRSNLRKRVADLRAKKLPYEYPKY